MIDARAALVFVDQRKRGAGDFVFARRAQAADDPLRERRLPRPEFARKQNQNRRLNAGSDFAAKLDCFFRRVRHQFTPSHGQTRNRNGDTRAESRESGPRPSAVLRHDPRRRCLPRGHEGRRRTRGDSRSRTGSNRHIARSSPASMPVRTSPVPARSHSWIAR